MRRSLSNDRSDSVQEKVRLLQDAYQKGRLDLASSLAESIRDTLRFDRQVTPDPEEPDLDAEQFVAVSELPKPWADWGNGWRFVQALSLFETIGQARTNEPIEIRLRLRADQVTDPDRELRVARFDAERSTIHEVPSQVSGVTRTEKHWRCRLAFLADVPQHDRAIVLVFTGNPNAERPDYITDLKVKGEGYGLEISNHHYVAQLSSQVGQLERLISRREHGLELYAGGKGHGEPPGIDWAHDYVDHGSFQKLRVRNWAECPDYEVERGPIFVRVRRWGFPHSPIHPLFTPSRMHIDQTYTFHSGLPYFFKEGTMEAIKDLRIEAMRDDEWVFSGYSYTNLIWFDASGKLHDGPVPPEAANQLWGVGFYHNQSHDAFLAFWLDHRVEGHDRIDHSGSPTLDYAGHGQLWSRYPAQKTVLKAGTVFHQRNAYHLFPFSGEDDARSLEAMRQRLLNPIACRADELPQSDRPQAMGSLARVGETEEFGDQKRSIWAALHRVKDEQLYTADASIVDLGYIYDVRVRAGVAHVIVTMPHRGRPVHEFLVSQGGGRVSEGIREHVRRVEGIQDVVVDLTWNPPWTVARLSDQGRAAMGLNLS
ncbi:metal-sulfur cluster assembly factor [Tautonia marina]|uniref:metal-sulfur cluster assembly factor n=1 Tax=Tautonia marina TaxID=2653855 RepID=UPI0012606B45|nr:metal-sulfur cluster assembly factor [Tautonia marina]